MTHSNLNKKRRRRQNITKASKQSKFLSYGGNLRILQKKECEDIHAAVLDILSNIGISHVSSKTQEVAVNNGIKFKNGRLYFSKALVEDTISALSRSVVLHGQNLKTIFRSLVAKSILVLVAPRQQFWIIKQISFEKRH